MTRFVAARHGVMLTVTEPPVAVCIDGLRVQQALDNLIDNALRHGRDVTSIDLAAECRGEALAVSVTDVAEVYAVQPTRAFAFGKAPASHTTYRFA